MSRAGEADARQDPDDVNRHIVLGIIIATAQLRQAPRHRRLIRKGQEIEPDDHDRQSRAHPYQA